MDQSFESTHMTSTSAIPSFMTSCIQMTRIWVFGLLLDLEFLEGLEVLAVGFKFEIRSARTLLDITPHHLQTMKLSSGVPKKA